MVASSVKDVCFEKFNLNNTFVACLGPNPYHIHVDTLKCTHKHIHTHIYDCVYMYLCICRFTYIHTFVCVYIHIC